MNKNIVIPLSIIIAAALVGGVVLFSGSKAPSNDQLTASTANLRTLELSVPGMFCAGCVASVEGYVSSMPGVKRVQARLTPTKSATVIYDPDLISKEKIVQNSIFDAYGVSILSDKPFTGSVSPTPTNGATIPQDVEQKAQEAARLLSQKTSEGKDVSAAQSLLNQVNDNIERGNFANASALLNTVIYSLQNL